MDCVSDTNVADFEWTKSYLFLQEFPNNYDYLNDTDIICTTSSMILTS